MLRRILIIVLFLWHAAAAEDVADDERIRYDNYRLYEVQPTSQAHLDQLTELQQRTCDSYIILQSSPRLYAFADNATTTTRAWQIVVAPHKLHEFRAFLRDARLPHSLVLSDLQAAIDSEARQTAKSSGTFGWTAYHALDSIYAWMDEIIADHGPHHVTAFTAGKSHEGRPLRGLRIAFDDDVVVHDAADANATTTTRKPGVLIEGGIHAREWISPAFVTYLINELLTSTDPAIRATATAHDWYILPTVNPDGYAYTHRSNRLWRKTRRPYGLWCAGADPNRNWDFHWNEYSTSPFPCSDIYAGPRAFSEPEVQGYAEFLRTLTDEKRLQVFVAMHSYSQMLLYPWGHTAQPTPNAADLKAIGEAAAEALAQRYGTKYRVGSIYETIYPASGASADYAYGVLGVPLAFTYELRPGSGGEGGGFELPAEQIVPVGEETVDSLVALLKRAGELGYFKGLA